MTRMHWIDPGAGVVGHPQAALGWITWASSSVGGRLGRRSAAVGAASASAASSRPGCAAMWMASVGLGLLGDDRLAGALAGAGHDLDHAPALGGRQRPRLLDAHGVADARLVALVVRLELRGQADDALVERMAREALDRDDDRLVHLVGDDAADLGLALRRVDACCSAALIDFPPAAARRAAPAAARLELALGLDGQQAGDARAASARSGCNRSAGGWPAGSAGRRGGAAPSASSSTSSCVGQRRGP